MKDVQLQPWVWLFFVIFSFWVWLLFVLKLLCMLLSYFMISLQCRHLVLWICLLKLISWCLITFDIFCSHFHSILKSLIFFLNSVLTHSLFSSELLSFYEFADFLLVILLLESSFNLGWSDRMQGVIATFLYLLRLVLSNYVVSLGESSMRCYKEGIW